MIVDTTTIPGYTIYRREDQSQSQSQTSASTSTSSAFHSPVPQPPEHPLDPLSIEEIPWTSNFLGHLLSPRQLKYNTISLREPPKSQLWAYRHDNGPKPDRCAFVIAFEVGCTTTTTATSSVYEGVVNLSNRRLDSWKPVKGVMPTLTLEDTNVTEQIVRSDPRVVDACRELGITDMSKVYCDAWAIGTEDRWPSDIRLHQGLMYYRSSADDNQYAHPLDFSVVVDTEHEQVISVDVRRVNGKRTPVPAEDHNYLPSFIKSGYRHDLLKPLNITQPAGVSFRMDGNVLSWCGYEMHVGFNYREGIVLSDISIHDSYQGARRPLFNRLSIVEMVVPYGCPESPHHKKQAFDVGEYGAGLMTNSLKLGCDCKGAIAYLDAVVSTSRGEPALIKNAVCIHEEDNGILYKHTDYRDGTSVCARDRKLVISQIITAANYEYAFYHIFHLDGTYKSEVKLTGILNSYPLLESEDAGPYGTEVAARVTAHNHQHIFCLRIDPMIDGRENTVIQNDAVVPEAPVGSEGNPYGNAFYCQKTPLRTSKEGAVDYCHETSRTWDIVNPNKLHPSNKKPVGFKIVTRESPRLLAKPGAAVWNRAGFAQKTMWITPYEDYQLFPAGDYVCQSTGRPNHPGNLTVVDWTEQDLPIENTDIVCWLQFGITHFPRTEDFPLMPAEAVSVMLRASNFFLKNPALWVPPVSSAVDPHSTLSAPKNGENSQRTGCSQL